MSALREIIDLDALCAAATSIKVKVEDDGEMVVELRGRSRATKRKERDDESDEELDDDHFFAMMEQAVDLFKKLGFEHQDEVMIRDLVRRRIENLQS